MGARNGNNHSSQAKGEEHMIWLLYIITGIANPSLQQVGSYADEQVCRKAAIELIDKGVRAICLPKEKST